eukprot:jgi/Bigna1/51736/estExt_Genewise1Plus.C_30056
MRTAAVGGVRLCNRCSRPGPLRWRPSGGSKSLLQRRALSSQPDYEEFLRPHAKRREASPIRALTPLLKIPGMISLGGGLPNPELFPFKSLDFELEDAKLSLTPTELKDALQYSNTPGLPSLLDFMTELQAREHKKEKTSEWSICVQTGSQEGIAKAVDMLIGPEDTVLVDDPTYAGTLALMRPIGCTLEGIACDGEGMIPENLQSKLEELKAKGIRPRVVYTVPTGQNPSGSTATEARKEQIYKIACEWNLLIMEDDPYRFGCYRRGFNCCFDATHSLLTPFSYLPTLPLFGRVMRFDSLSKILSSGLRLGCVTGPTALVDRINLHTQASNLHPSGVSQALCAKLLHHWGQDGWERHVKKVALYYMKRRDVFEALARKYLSAYAEWTTPSAGMFVW